MKIKAGFFYNTGDFYHKRFWIVICFVENHLEFKRVNPAIVPYSLGRLDSGSRYPLDYPILYQEDDLGTITKIIFLDNDIPLLTLEDVKESKGFALLSPNMRYKTASLYYDGESVSFGKGFSLERYFYESVIDWYAVRKTMLFYKNATKPLALATYLKKVKEIKSYIDTIDIHDILKGLSVYVSEYIRIKTGDNDTYFLDYTASLPNPKAKEDAYLVQLIQLGSKTVYQKDFYCGKPEPPKEYQPLGCWDENRIAQEKERILALYSKEEHLGYLLSAFMSDRDHLRDYDLPIWESTFKKVDKIIRVDFRLEEVMGNDISSHFSCTRATMNEQYDQRMVDLVNRDIKVKTTTALKTPTAQRYL